MFLKGFRPLDVTLCYVDTVARQPERDSRGSRPTITFDMVVIRNHRMGDSCGIRGTSRPFPLTNQRSFVTDLYAADGCVPILVRQGASCVTFELLCG